MKCIFLIFTSGLSLCQADSMTFDDKLYHGVLDPELCEHQLKNMDKNKFYDSSFRVPEGLLDGNFVSLGNYYQCLAINQEFLGSNIEGKYCMIDAQLTATPTLKIPSLGGVSESNNLTWTEWKFNWSRNDVLYYQRFDKGAIQVSKTALSKKSAYQVIESLSLSLAVCVPKPCTVDALLRPYAEHPLINFNYSEQFCRLPGDKPIVGIDYVVFVILSLLGLLTVLSTLYELRYIFIFKKDPAEASELFRACSLYSNTARLVTFTENPQALDCLDGIRCLSMLWLIIFHTYYQMTVKCTNNLEIRKEMFGLKTLWLLSAWLAVDTFFFLSGMLLVYSATYKMKQKTLLRSLHLFYVNRYVRLFPVLAGALLLQMSVMHQMADGPGWHYVAHKVDLCRNYWWSVLLHVQNIVNPTNMCLAHSWYLSVDMQLYVVSPLVLYWVLGSARAAWSALSAAVVASLAATLAVCFHFNFPMRYGVEFWRWYYKNTIPRSPPFFLGMLFGYILHVFRGEKLKLQKWIIFLCYSLALVLSFYAFYILHPTMQPDWDNQPALNVHNALYRSCWSLALGWLIFACAHEYGGPVNWFLSLKLWRFPARISYAMYLFSYPVQTLLLGAAVQPFYFDTKSLLMKFAGEVVFTVVLSVAACVVLEAPVVTLHKLLLKRIQKGTERD